MRQVDPELLSRIFLEMKITNGNHFVRAYTIYKQCGITDDVREYLIQVRDSIVAELEGIQTQHFTKPEDQIQALTDALYILNSLLVPDGTTLH